MCSSPSPPTVRWDKEIGESLEALGPASRVCTVMVNSNDKQDPASNKVLGQDQYLRSLLMGTHTVVG